MTYIINCKVITNITDFHNQIKEVLELPDYYGKNFDALFDLLGELCTTMDKLQLIEVRFKNFGYLIKVLEPRIIIQIINVFDSWKVEYPDIQIKVVFEL